MRIGFITLVFGLLFSNSFSQNPGFEYKGRLTRTIKKDKLKKTLFISQVVPDFWQNLGLPYEARNELNLRKKMDYGQRFSITPQDFEYNKILEIVSAEITSTNQGKQITTQSISDLLTMEQRNLLVNADYGSDISIRVRFKYKDQANSQADSKTNVIEGVLMAVVVPEVEAEFDGGLKQLSDYYTKNVINRIDPSADIQKLSMAVVKFTVDEQGQVVDAKIARSTNDAELDRLLLDATLKMPIWTPAHDARGIKVKQEFSIPFGNGGC